MPNYKEMYVTLFRSQTKAIDLLQKAQQETEDMYIESDEPEIKILPIRKDENPP